MEIEGFILKQHLGTEKHDLMIQIYFPQLRINIHNNKHNSENSTGKDERERNCIIAKHWKI